MNKELYQNNNKKLRNQLLNIIQKLCKEHIHETTIKIRKVHYIRKGLMMIKEYFFEYNSRHFSKEGLYIFLPNNIIINE